MEEKSYFGNCLYFASGSFFRNISKMAEEAFAKTGMAPSYAFILMLVNQYNEGVNPSKIAQELHLTPSTITRFLDKLEQKEYIIRSHEGKSTVVKATKKSMNMQEELAQAWMDLYLKYSSIFGEDHANKLAATLYESSTKLNK